MAVGTMSTFMEHLVAGARSSRDSAFNTLDAIDRQTRAASSQLAQRVEQVIAEHPAPQSKAAAEAPDQQQQVPPASTRDARFDPEDEWEVTGPDGAVSAPPLPAASGRGGTDDEDDYPPTWLR